MEKDEETKEWIEEGGKEEGGITRLQMVGEKMEVKKK
jgi:hypothetical protein